MFGIHDLKFRERLLCEKNLSLEKTDEICHSHETVQQVRVQFTMPVQALQMLET